MQLYERSFSSDFIQWITFVTFFLVRHRLNTLNIHWKKSMFAERQQHIEIHHLASHIIQWHVAALPYTMHTRLDSCSLSLSQQRGSANFDLILPKMPALLLYLHCKITPLWLAQGNKMMKISIHLHCTGPKNGWKQLLMWLLKITGDTENWWVTYVNILSNLLIVLQKRCQIR